MSGRKAGQIQNQTKPHRKGDRGILIVLGSVVLGMIAKIARAAEILQVRVATLSDLLNEKAALSPEMALRLEKAFGLKMETLLKMQAWYDAAKMRSEEDSITIARYIPS